MREKEAIGRVQQRRSRAEVEQLVEAFESSGLRRREFCQKHDVAVGTLDFWRKRRRQKREMVAGYRLSARKVDARAEMESDGRLVAVELAGTAAVGRLTVVLPRGQRVEVSEGFDAATLERLLGVLERVWVVFGLGAATRIYLAVGRTDMRKGFNGLYGLVRDRLQCEPLSGHVFLFCNGQRNRVKLMFWDGSGLWVCAKKLEKGRFRWPEVNGDQNKVQLSNEELALLLGGIDLREAERRRWYRRGVAEEPAA